MKEQTNVCCCVRHNETHYQCWSWCGCVQAPLDGDDYSFRRLCVPCLLTYGSDNRVYGPFSKWEDSWCLLGLCCERGTQECSLWFYKCPNRWGVPCICDSYVDDDVASITIFPLLCHNYSDKSRGEEACCCAGMGSTQSMMFWLPLGFCRHRRASCCRICGDDCLGGGPCCCVLRDDDGQVAVYTPFGWFPWEKQAPVETYGPPQPQVMTGPPGGPLVDLQQGDGGEPMTGN
jgi:hypothetical protein